MKQLIFTLVVSFLLVNCNTTQLVESWKSPDIDTYTPSKVLVVGLTSYNDARQKFENKLKTELEYRGLEVVMSFDFLNTTADPNRFTEVQLDSLENKLIEDGFDTILLTKIIGVEDKIVYKENYSGYDETYRKFKEEYLMYQDVFYNPDYYEEYRIYKAETSMYCICPTKERELLWKGYINITDPRSLEETVNEYVNLAIAVLEAEKLIFPKVINLDEKVEDSIIQ